MTKMQQYLIALTQLADAYERLREVPLRMQSMKDMKDSTRMTGPGYLITVVDWIPISDKTLSEARETLARLQDMEDVIRQGFGPGVRYSFDKKTRLPKHLRSPAVAEEDGRAAQAVGGAPEGTPVDSTSPAAAAATSVVVARPDHRLVADPGFATQIADMRREAYGHPLAADSLDLTIPPELRRVPRMQE